MIRLIFTILSCLVLVNCGNESSENEKYVQAVKGRITVTNHYSDGFYSVDLSIAGKPFNNVLIDTGSSNLIVFGDSKVCPTCFKPESYNTSPNLVIQTYSPTSEPLYNGAKFTIEYGDGSPPQKGSAQLHLDNINFKDNDGSAINYPLGVFVQGTRVQNILGLAYPRLVQSIQESRPMPFFDQYILSNKLNDLFSLNLCPSGVSGNFMTLGHIDYAVAPTSLRYTHVLKDSLLTIPDYDFYHVAPKTLSIEGEPVALAQFPSQSERYFTIVDSGTSLLFLPASMIASIGTYYASKLGIPEDFWNLPDDLNQVKFIDPALRNQLKDLIITFPDVNGGTFEFKISSQSYTLRVRKDDGGIGLISLLKSAHPPESSANGYYPGVVVLGDVFMENAYTVFDRKNHQIGFFPNRTLCGSESQIGIDSKPSQIGKLQPRSLSRRFIPRN